MNKIWSDIAWEEYVYWQAQDKNTLKRKVVQRRLGKQMWLLLQ